MTPTTDKKPKYTEESKARMENIGQIVNDPANTTRFQQATTATEVRELATECGLTLTKESGDIPKLIVNLRSIGVDLPALAKQEQADRAADLVNRRDELPALTLAAAAIQDPDDDSSASYAVVDDLNRAVVYGALFDNDYERIWTPGDPGSAEQSAADKAVYIAYRARKASGLDGVALTLVTTYPDLDTDALIASGGRLGVAVEIDVDHDHDAAVHQAGMTGYRSLKQVSEDQLAALIDDEPVTDDSADTDDPADEDTDDAVVTGHSDESPEGK